MVQEKDEDDFFDEDSEIFHDFVPEKQTKLEEKENKLDVHMSRAPTVVIERFTVGKPLKVLCLLLMLLALLLFAISLLSVSWMRTKGSRMGLFQECIYDTLVEPSCYINECVSWEFKALSYVALSVAGLTLLDFIFLSIAMVILQPKAKTCLYITVVMFNVLAAIAEIVVCVLYPLIFIQRFGDPKAVYTQGHTHGGDVRIGYCLVAGSCGAGLLLLGTILLCVDRSSDEVFYREKVIRDIEEEVEE